MSNQKGPFLPRYNVIFCHATLPVPGFRVWGVILNFSHCDIEFISRDVPIELQTPIKNNKKGRQFIARVKKFSYAVFKVASLKIYTGWKIKFAHSLCCANLLQKWNLHKMWKFDNCHFWNGCKLLKSWYLQHVCTSETFHSVFGNLTLKKMVQLLSMHDIFHVIFTILWKILCLHKKQSVYSGYSGRYVEKLTYNKIYLSRITLSA